MKLRDVSAIVVGLVMYALVIVLASVQRDLTFPQFILMLVTPFVIGFLVGGVKKGLIFGFIIPFVMLIVEAVILQSGAFADPNTALATVLMLALPFGLISAVLGAAGGFAGRRVFKK
jgi:uncharacterized membrane protein